MTISIEHVASCYRLVLKAFAELLADRSFDPDATLVTHPAQVATAQTV